jgi:uncharacterized protein (TIGR00730 family)
VGILPQVCNAMSNKTPAICVFCGASFGADPRYGAAAERLGRLLAEGGFTLIFGGGGPGLMGAMAKAVIDGGARVRGILPGFLRGVEKPPEWEQELEITPDLQLRKTKMLAEADAFVILPGGAGTMDEFFEVVTSAQLHVLAKPIVLVNVAGYFEPLLKLMRHIVDQGFARNGLLDVFAVVETPDDAIDMITEKLGLRE